MNTPMLIVLGVLGGMLTIAVIKTLLGRGKQSVASIKDVPPTDPAKK